MRRPRCVRDASDRTWHESHWIMFMSLLLYTSMQIGQYCFCANLRPHGVHISYPLYQPPFGCVVPHEPSCFHEFRPLARRPVFFR